MSLRLCLVPMLDVDVSFSTLFSTSLCIGMYLYF
jgi:hypothetical protein